MDCPSRRKFLKYGAGTLAAAGLLHAGCGGDGAPAQPLACLDELPLPRPAVDGPMPTRTLGRTGWEVPIFSLGGQATLEQQGRDDEADAIIRRALDLGVNYIDTSDNYGDGSSETYIGRVMATRRDEVFLATKTGNWWSAAGALAGLRGSLARLQTEYVDLWLLHGVRTQDDLAAIFAPGGAIDAFREAKRQGMTRFLGVSGHYDPAVLVSAFDRFDQAGVELDVALMALNAGDRAYRSFVEVALPVAVQRGIGIVAMKVVGHGYMLRPGSVSTMEQAMSYTLSLPVHTAIIGCDSVQQVEENVAIARRFAALSQDGMACLEEAAAPWVRQNNFYKWEW